MRTRRWFYFVPAKGTPKKLVHRIEAGSLAALPGETLYYAGQKELRDNLKKALSRVKESGDAVLTQERDSLRRHGRCRDDRAWCAVLAPRS